MTIATDSFATLTPARPLRVRGLAACVLLMLACAAPAAAQQYDADPVDDKAGSLKPTAEQCARIPGRYAADKAKFDEFFQKFYFPAMTRYGTNDLAQLGRMREDLFSRFLWASADERLQADLTNMAFEKLKPVERSSGKRYHPAVRYNAILILGMLDQPYAAGNTPPVPLKAATAELNLIVNAAAAGKAVPPFLVVGALVGLERHSRFDDKIDSALLAEMSSAVLKLATKDEPLPEVDAKVSDWIRVQAATVLANLGNPGPQGEVLAAFTKMVAGKTVPKMSLDARLQVAALAGRFKFENAKVDANAAAAAMLQLALEVGDAEAKEAKAFEDLQVGTSGYGTAASRNSKRMKFDMTTSVWEYDSSIMLARLADLRAGLKAFQAIAPADKQQVFATVAEAIAPAVAAAENVDASDLEVAGKAVAMGAAIRAAVEPGSAPAADAAAAEVF